MLGQFAIPGEQFESVYELGDTDDNDHKKIRYNYAMSVIQQHVPGNYILEEQYNVTLNLYYYKIKFLSKKDEMWYYLKYL